MGNITTYYFQLEFIYEDDENAEDEDTKEPTHFLTEERVKQYNYSCRFNQS